MTPASLKIRAEMTTASFDFVVIMAHKSAQQNKRSGRRRNGQNNNETRVSLPNHVNLKPTYTVPYKFSRTFEIGGLPKAATDLGHAFPFALSLLPNYSEFATLFDRYRIRKVDVRMTLDQLSTGSGVTRYPTVWAYMDDDDASIPTSKSTVLERQSVRPFTYTEAATVYSVSLQPRWLLDGTNKQSLAPRDMWIDMTTPSVSHYGLKLWIDNYNTTSGGYIKCDAVIHFECACVR